MTELDSDPIFDAPARRILNQRRQACSNTASATGLHRYDRPGSTRAMIRAVPPIYSICGRNLGILHHPRTPFPAGIRSSTPPSPPSSANSSSVVRRSTQNFLPSACPSYKFRPAQKSGPFRVVPDSVCDPHTILLHGVLSNFRSRAMRQLEIIAPRHQLDVLRRSSEASRESAENTRVSVPVGIFRRDSRTGGSRRCSDSDDSACEAWRRCAASGTSCAWR